MGEKRKIDAKTLSVMIGSGFLMATSAIGPGFINNTAKLTAQFGAAFLFICICGILLDICIQMTIWPVIGVSGMRVPDIGNKLLKGWGFIVLFFVAVSSFGYNIGNIGGGAMGLEVACGLSQTVGCFVTMACGLLVFWWKDLGNALDRTAQVLGGLMLIGIFVVLVANFPSPARAVSDVIVEMPKHSLLTMGIPLLAVMSTYAGGYVPLSGPQRLIDAGITGQHNLPKIRQSALVGIAVSETVRMLLLLCVLGIVYRFGVSAVEAAMPAASAFRAGLGELGYRLFGIILYFASLTSVVGCSYTVASLLRSLHPALDKNTRVSASVIVVLSTIIMSIVGQPANVLLFVGVLAAYCIPFTLGTLLIAAYRKDIVGPEFKQNVLMTVIGIVVVLVVAYTGVGSIRSLLAILF